MEIEKIESISEKKTDQNAIGFFKTKYANHINLFFTTMNVINCIFGTGIIALPYASQKSGLGLSLLLMPLAGSLSVYTCLLVVVICNRTGAKSYSEVVEKVLGKKYKYVILFSNFLLPSIACIAYGVAIYENLTNVFKYINFGLGMNKIFILFICLGLIVFPLSLFKDLKFLEQISMLSVIFILFYTIVFVVNVQESSSKVFMTSDYFRFGSSGFVQSLGTFFFSFTIHHNIVSLFYSSGNRSEAKFVFSVGISTVVAILIYIICIFAGFLSFPGIAKSNIFENYCENNRLVLAARFIFTITILATYPFQLIASRETLHEIILIFTPIKSIYRYIFTFSLVLIFGISSYFANSFGTVLEIGGCLTASPLVLIIPPLLYMKYFYKSFKIDSFQKLMMYAIIAFGFVLMFLGTTFAVLDAIKESDSQMSNYHCEL